MAFSLRFSFHRHPKRVGWSPLSNSTHRSRMASLSLPQPLVKTVATSRWGRTAMRPSLRGNHTVCHSCGPRASFRFSGFLCCAALNGRILSQTTDPPEMALRRTQRVQGEGSGSLTVRKEEPCAKVEFQIKFRTDHGHIVKIVGSASQFGAWAIAKSPAMTWNEGDLWSAKIELPVGSVYEYKYVVVDAHGASVVHWQKGNNCVLAIGMTDRELVVGDNWEGSPGASVTSRGKGIATKEERLLDWAAEIKSHASDNSALVLEKKRELEKAQEENRVAKEEASRLKSELRMASMTRQSAEQQVKELQQENRRLLALLTEQQDIHKNVMEQALSMLKDCEISFSDSDVPSASTEPSQDAPSTTASPPDPPPRLHENGTASETPKRRKPRRKSNRRRRPRVSSTRTAALSSFD